MVNWIVPLLSSLNVYYENDFAPSGKTTRQTNFEKENKLDDGAHTEKVEEKERERILEFECAESVKCPFGVLESAFRENVRICAQCMC